MTSYFALYKMPPVVRETAGVGSAKVWNFGVALANGAVGVRAPPPPGPAVHTGLRSAVTQSALLVGVSRRARQGMVQRGARTTALLS